ncbi:hypothetical protein BDP27DRAFT_1376338 [Rhodocollybia butyracea]|uniref:C2H2-type domain-containing protein n=1 Tax=Rhodocollybia butyracea TaxID=206335 RepID=A0A9P5TVZ3_9AGAR|nr:hypothetical protein BDP27DRAFT_1376338 [Rhodocollybia butyracea]
MLPEPNVIRRENQQELMEPSKNSVPRSTPILRTPPTLYTHVEDVAPLEQLPIPTFLWEKFTRDEKISNPNDDTFNLLRTLNSSGQHRKSWFGELPERTPTRDYEVDGFNHMKPVVPYGGALPHSRRPNTNSESAQNRQYSEEPALCEQSSERPTLKPGQLQRAAHVYAPTCNNIYEQAHPRGHLTPPTPTISPSSKTKSGRKEIKNSGLKALQGVILPKKYEFRRQGSYRGHLRTHTCFQNFWCEVCGKGFTDLIGKARHNARLTCKAPNPDRRDDGPDPRFSSMRVNSPVKALFCNGRKRCNSIEPIGNGQT